MRFVKSRISRVLVLSFVLLAACGYRFSGSGTFPGKVNSIFVSVLENRTNETGLENRISNDLIYEFTRNNSDIIAKPRQAEALLGGIIRSVSTQTISRRGDVTSNEQRVRLSVDLEMTDAAGKILWRASGLSANETYDVSGDKQQTERNRRAAIDRASRRLAENVYKRLTEDF